MRPLRALLDEARRIDLQGQGLLTTLPYTVTVPAHPLPIRCVACVLLTVLMALRAVCLPSPRVVLPQGVLAGGDDLYVIWVAADPVPA